jgi:predicted GIY-YIG superfamily endonuclease
MGIPGPRGPNMRSVDHLKPAHTYVLWDAADAPLYAGATSDLESRIRQHRRGPFGSEIAYVTSTEYPTRAAAFAAECDLLRELKPLHNKKGVTYNVGNVA